MRRIRIAALAFALCLSVNPAFAGIAIINGGGTGGNVATGSINGSANVTSGATTVDVPIGSLVFMSMSVRSNVNFTCSDSASNSYTAVSANNASGQGSTTCWSITTHDLPIGSTFTGTQANTGAKGIIVAAFSGVATSSTLDPASPTGTSGNSISPSVGPSGTWAGATVQLAMYTISVTNSPTDGGSWISLGTLGAATAGSIHMAYQITASTSATTYAPTNSTSGLWATQLRGFAAAAGTSPNKALLFRAIP